MIYLDNAATTFPKPEQVYTAMDEANRNLAFNAGRGSYAAARKAAEIIDRTRRTISQLLHADSCADIVFTPSVTHAINQIVSGLCLDGNNNVYISPYEHNAVARTVYAAAIRTGCHVQMLPLGSDLKVDLERTAYQFSIFRPDFVFMSAISNVTGYILPTEVVFSLAKEYGAVTIMDAAQAVGLLDIDMARNHAGIICFAGHKTLNGPFGIGGFAIRRGLDLNGSFTGGTGSDSLNLAMPSSVPEKYEAASQNIPAYAGLLAALDCCDVTVHEAKIRELTGYAIQRLKVVPKLTLKGAYEDGSTIGILSFVMEDYTSDEIGSILADEYDIAVRTGYHCAPYIHAFLNDKASNGTVRIGLGQFNTAADIDALAGALELL